MLRKNIYILYPPGYSGSYINWCISKSEQDLSHSTIDDPLNTADNLKYGGVGTSHLHHRIPTHAGLRELVTWLVLNKPVENKIFLVNAGDDIRFQEHIAWILSFDRDPVIIQITATDRHTQSIGNLNCVTKWPLFFDITGVSKKHDLTFPCENNISTRNKFVIHYDEIFSTSYPLEYNKENTNNRGFRHVVDAYAHWYNTRHAHNPHEVNNAQYVEPYYVPKHYYAIDLMKVYSPDFIDLLKSIVEDCDAGVFDFTHVREYHPKYVNAQPHLKFLDEIKEFSRTKQLTDYLCSHPLIQAYVVMDLLPELSNNNWLDQTLQEIVKGVQSQ
jgi:hypothetical protein